MRFEWRTVMNENKSENLKLTDEALEGVGGGMGGTGDYKCVLCGKPHRITKYEPWPVKYSGKTYIGIKYACNVNGVFYEVPDYKGQVIYFNNEMIPLNL